MPQISDDQMMTLMKTHPRAKAIMLNNITKRVESQTAPLQQSIKEKDEEIAKLKEDLEAAEAKAASTEATAPAAATESGEDGKETLAKEIEELKSKLATAENQRQAAVQQATATADKKAMLQANMLRNVQAKIEVVRKAAVDTPEKIVKEVWDVANATKPAPTPAKPTSTPAAGAASPAAPKSTETPASPAPKPDAPTPTQTPAARRLLHLLPLLCLGHPPKSKPQPRKPTR